MKKEFNFKGAKRGARVNPSKTKISINTRLDMDVVLWLKQEAEKRGIPYQTLMNSFLKERSQASSSLDLAQTVRDVIREELKPFKKAVGD